MGRRLLVPAALAAAALIAAGCGSSGNSTTPSAHGGGSTHSGMPVAAGNGLKTTAIGGAKVLTNAKGRTLYWFGPDTATKSMCNGSCAGVWPPVPGPTKAGSGVTGKLGTIKRSDGSVQATYNGHPLYTYTGDSAPGQANGNGINLQGGVWHEVTVTGAAPAPSSSSSAKGGGGYKY